MGNFGCSVVTLVTFSSILDNIEKIPKIPKSFKSKSLAKSKKTTLQELQKAAVTINAVSENGDLVFYTTELFQTSDGDTANPGWLRAS